MLNNTLDILLITQPLLNDGYAIRVSAWGCSMKPLITNGQTIIVKPYKIKIEELQGKIIAYKNAMGKMVVHRVIKIQEGLIYTKGDALSRIDDPITASQIVGEVELPSLMRSQLMLYYAYKTYRALKLRIHNLFSASRS